MNDFRLALRALRRSPLFTAVAIASVAVGIGANLTVFGVVNALLLRPLPVADPERLVRVGRTTREAAFATVSYPELRELRDITAGVVDLVGHFPSNVVIAAGDDPATAWIELVTANYFDVLGVRPALGRVFVAADEGAPESAPFLVLAHEFWTRRFGKDAGVIGRAVRLNGRPFTVVGVAPPAFRGTFAGFNIDAWVPVTMQATAVPNVGSITGRENRFLMMLARLRAPATLERARSTFAVAAARLRAEQQDTSLAVRLEVRAASGVHPFIAGILRAFLALLQGIVLLVLFLACVNLANVLLVRASARRRELAVRSALGASRWRIARLLFAESIVVAAAGGVAGLAIAGAAGRLLERLPLDVGIPVALTLDTDHRVVIAALAITVVAAAAFGAGPALLASRGDALVELRVAGATTDRRRSRLRGLLVAAQVVVATVLLVGSGLMMRSLQRSEWVDLGFESSNLFLFSASPELLGYDEARGRALWDEIVARSGRVPGVRAAALALFVPLGSRSDVLAVAPADRSRRPQALPYNMVGPGYLRMLGIPLLAGREIAVSDRRGAPDVVVVSATMARRLFGTEHAVGRSMIASDRGGRERRLEVVGVVGDIKLRSMGEAPRPLAYLPFGQWYRADMVLHVRPAVPGALRVREIVEQMRSVEPDLAVDVQTMSQATQFSLIPLRVAGAVLGFSSAIGLLIAALGVFGLVAYDVSLRGREIAIRMALGARRPNVLRSTLTRGIRPVLAGLGAGLLLAVAAGTLVRGILVGIGPRDPLTLVGATVILLVSAAAAVSLPAWRAMTVDPARLLRDD